MKVIYTKINNEEEIIENVAKISSNGNGLIIWKEDAALDEFVFISNSLSYWIVLDSPSDVYKLITLGKINLCELLLNYIEDSSKINDIDDLKKYLSSLLKAYKSEI